MSVQYDPRRDTYTARPPHSHRRLSPKSRINTGVYRKRSFATAKEADDYVKACADNDWLSGVNEITAGPKKGIAVDVQNAYNDYTPASSREYFLFSDFGGNRDETLAAAKVRRREVLTAKANHQPTPMHENSVQNTPVWERPYSLTNLPTGMYYERHGKGTRFIVSDLSQPPQSRGGAKKPRHPRITFTVRSDDVQSAFTDALDFWRKTQRAVAAAAISVDELDELELDDDDDIAFECGSDE